MNPPRVASRKPYHLGRIWPTLLLLAAMLAWLRPFRARVSGNSMAPTLSDGDVVVAVRGLKPRRGDLAVVRHGGVEMIKRVEGAPGGEPMPGWVLGPGQWLVTGDNREVSTDSRRFGPLSSEEIVARVIWPLRPKEVDGRPGRPDPEAV